MNIEFKAYYHAIPIDIVKKDNNFNVFYHRFHYGSGSSAAVSGTLDDTGSARINYSCSVRYKFLNKFVSYGIGLYTQIIVTATPSSGSPVSKRLRGFLKPTSANGTSVLVYSSGGTTKTVPLFRYSESDVVVNISIAKSYDYTSASDLVDQILADIKNTYFDSSAVIDSSSSFSDAYFSGVLTSAFSYPGTPPYGLTESLLMVDYLYHIFMNGGSNHFDYLSDAKYLLNGISLPMTSPGFTLKDNITYDSEVQNPYHLIYFSYSSASKINAVLVNLSSCTSISPNTKCNFDPEGIGIIDNKIENESDLVNKLFLTPDQDFYNIGKYLLSVGVPSLYMYPVPQSNAEYYIRHLLSPIEDGDVGPLLKEDLTFLVFLLPFGEGVVDSLLYYIDNHLNVASNKKPDFESEVMINRIGQLERYVFIGVKPDVDTVSMVRKNFALTSGKRTVIVTANYTDPYALFFSSSNAEIPSGKLYVTIGDNTYDATWQLIALQTLLTYLSIGQYTVPLTNKYVPGISFRGSKLGMNKLSSLFNEGALILVADRSGDTSALCYRSILSSYGFWKKDQVQMSYPEDMELSILFVEDLMDKENRNYLKQFRGEKLSTKFLQFIQSQFENVVLSGYVSRGWIEAYRNVKLWQDPNDPTIIRGYYEYRPIYPINKIWIEHFFIV